MEMSIENSRIVVKICSFVLLQNNVGNIQNNLNTIQFISIQ